MLLSHGVHVLVVDGGGMRLFRNRGRDTAPDLDLLKARTFDNPRTHVLSEPMPGRSFESMGVTRRAYEGTDTHQLREDHFCEAALDEALAEAGEDGDLILIAPAHAMGVLRNHLRRHPRTPRIHEIVKDLAAFEPAELGEYLRNRR